MRYLGASVVIWIAVMIVALSRHPVSLTSLTRCQCSLFPVDSIQSVQPRESLISATQNFLNLPGASGPTTSPIDVPEDHMALTPKTGTSSAVSLATAGSVPPSLTAKSGTGASLPAAGGPTADWKYPL